MRVITLPKEYEEANNMFGIFYAAAFGGAGAKDAAGARKMMKLQDELEGVLNRRAKELRLEDSHWSLLKGRIYSDDIRWAAGVTRQVLGAFDAVEGAEEVRSANEKAAT